MTLTILYFNPCRRERLRFALAHTIHILGPRRAATTVLALQQAYQPTRSTRINYNFALHALLYVVGLDGLSAISLVKEAWSPGSLAPLDDTLGQETVADITHPTTNTIQ